MAAKKKGPGKGRGPATRPASPAKRTTVPKPAAARSPGGQAQARGKPAPSATPPPASAAAKGAAAKGAAAAGAAAQAAGPTNPAPASGTSSPTTPTTPPSGVAPTANAAQAPSKPGSAPAKPAPAGSAGRSTRTKASGAPVAPAAPPTGKGRPRGGPTREERLAAAAAARRKQSIRNRALLAGGVVTALVVVGFVIVSDRREREQQAAQLETGSCRFDRQTDPDGGPNRNHTPTPSYKVNPPAGGDHTPQAAGAGVFTEANAPVDGQIVHAMEHGYVVLWYRPDLDESSLNAYREVAQRHARDVLVVPRPSLKQPVAVTAWHARILCDAVDVDATDRFINLYANKGPEKVKH